MIVRLRDAMRLPSGEMTTAVIDPGARIEWQAGVVVFGRVLIPWSNVTFVEGFDAPAGASRSGRRDTR